MVTLKRVQPSGMVWIQHGDLMAQRTVPELAAWLDVTPQTVRRWCRGSRIPMATQHALRLLLGEIDGLPGFHVDENGRLWAPGWKRGHTAAELENWHLVYQWLEVTRRELLEVRANVTRLPWQARPEPKPAPARRRFMRYRSA